MPVDAMSYLPAEARAALDEYIAALDGALRGRAEGVYVTGSAVLGDWQPSRSDLDILVVTAGALDDGELAELEALHAAISDRPYRDAVYVPADTVGARDEAIAYPAAVDGVFHRARHRPEPVLWATLDRHGLTVRGADAKDLGAGPDPDWLRDWNHGNLESYWRPWAVNVRVRLASLGPSEPLPAYPVTWAALGPGRLHATITTGDIISKTAAADYTAGLLPQHTALLERAKAHRLGDDTIAFSVADGLAACDLIDGVVSDAARLRSR
jgi:predicted nucleotidyltransferase